MRLTIGFGRGESALAAERKHRAGQAGPCSRLPAALRGKGILREGVPTSGFLRFVRARSATTAKKIRSSASERTAGFGIARPAGRDEVYHARAMLPAQKPETAPLPAPEITARAFARKQPAAKIAALCPGFSRAMQLAAGAATSPLAVLGGGGGRRRRPARAMRQGRAQRGALSPAFGGGNHELGGGPDRLGQVRRTGRRGRRLAPALRIGPCHQQRAKQETERERAQQIRGEQAHRQGSQRLVWLLPGLMPQARLPADERSGAGYARLRRRGRKGCGRAPFLQIAARASVRTGPRRRLRQVFLVKHRRAGEKSKNFRAMCREIQHRLGALAPF